MNNSHKLPKAFWAGFTDGKIDLDHFVSPTGKIYGVLYNSKKAARECYNDVRRVELREVRAKHIRGGDG